jgi:hypothetical protein
MLLTVRGAGVMRAKLLWMAFMASSPPAGVPWANTPEDNNNAATAANGATVGMKRGIGDPSEMVPLDGAALPTCVRATPGMGSGDASSIPVAKHVAAVAPWFHRIT